MQIATTPVTSQRHGPLPGSGHAGRRVFPGPGRLDDQIDDLEDEILQAPTDEQLGRLFDMKRS